MNRKAFTLIELLVVILIVGIAAVAVVPTVYTSLTELGARSTCQMIEGKILNATTEAVQKNIAGIRFVAADPSWPIATITDPTRSDFGQVDPSKPLVYNQIVNLVKPPSYSSGLVNSPTTYPNGFIATIGLDVLPNNPTFNRIILEESLVDTDGFRTEPTNWYWNIRLGDVVSINEAKYTVCGPMIMGPADGNSECFVNIGPPGQALNPTLRKLWVLDRGSGPIEWLCLTNQIDDNKDGIIDSGWNGLDDNLNTLIDEPAEWEREVYLGANKQGFSAIKYDISRRLVPSRNQTTTIPANVVIDVSRWDRQPFYHNTVPWTDTMGGVHTKAGFDYTPIRSRLPIDLYTGYVDILFDRTGRVTPSSIYGMAQTPMGDNKLVFWIAAREDVDTEIPTLDASGNPVLDTLGNPTFTLPPLKGIPFTVTLDRLTGDVKTDQLDPNSL